MTESKTDILSLHYKNEGNKFFQKGSYGLSLDEYNKALVYAVSKENVAFAYANRSAAYLELKLYQECLQNIQWARENGYPADKIHKLDVREEKCKNLLANKKEDNQQMINDFFKLSYPANPKIPFIIDGLEVRMTEKFGRGIFTTRDLIVGDMIMHDPHVLCFATPQWKYMKCCNCLTENSNNLIPCLKTASMMFCSVQCRDEVYRIFNDDKFDLLVKNDDEAKLNRILLTIDDAFGGRDNLMKFIEEINVKKWNKTVFDFDFSDPNDPNYKQNQLKSILSYYATNVYGAKFRDRTKVIKKLAQGNRKLAKFLEHISLVWDSSNTINVPLPVDTKDHSPHPIELNSMTVDKEHRLNQLTPLINYSCYPNIERLLFEKEMVFFVTRPIKAGEQLFRLLCSPKIFLGPVFMRQLIFKSDYSYECQCFYCENNLTAHDLPDDPIPYNMPPEFESNYKTTKGLIKNIKGIFKYYQENESLIPIGTYDCFQDKLLLLELLLVLTVSKFSKNDNANVNKNM